MIYCCKKVYIDKLESVDKNGNVITGDHVRLKSVPTSCINHTTKNISQECNDSYSLFENLEWNIGLEPMDIYAYLYRKGTQIQFDLTENGNNCGFNYDKYMSIRSHEEHEITRTISFPENIKRIPEINIERV